MTKRREIQRIRPPVARGQFLTLAIEGLNHQGEGVGRFQGFTVFVPGAVPGDLVSCRVISLKQSYARALVEQVVQPSAHRVVPPCLHYTHCGGCQLQHLEYPEQLLHKQRVVEDALGRLGGINAPVLPVIGMQYPWAYRNKAQIPVSTEGGNVVAGFYRRKSHHLIDVQSCPVQMQGNDALFRAIPAAVEEAGVSIYSEENHTGCLRHVAARTSLWTGETLLVLVTREEEIPEKKALIQAFASRVKNLAGIVQNVNPRQGNVIFDRRDIPLWGRPYLEERLGNLVFRISPRSFFQVNTLQAEVLLEKVRELAGLSGIETVYDLYCGTGAIGLSLSPFARKVIGVESSGEAVRDARENSRLNGIENADFIQGRAEQVMPERLRESSRGDMVLVDPPRGGCRPELLQAIVSARPEKVVYVSCNPASLARDLKYLAGEGYIVTVIQPVDMFPHTYHVECVVLMSRSG